MTNTPRPRLLLLLGLLAAAPAAAQAPTVAPGSRVRVEAPVLGPGRTVRRLVHQRGDTLVLAADRRTGGDTVAVALADVTGLEVSRGSRGRAIGAGVAGFVLGAAVGAVYGYNKATPDLEPCYGLFTCRGPSRREEATVHGILGAAAGGALGAVIGRFALGERWARLLPRGGRVSAGPRAGGGVRVAVTFR